MTIQKSLVNNRTQFSKFVRELRTLTDLTQEQFAAAVGVTYSTINRWENERSKPSPIAMRRIEEMLQDMGDQGKDLLAKYLK